MGILDSIFGQSASNVDIAGLAEKAGVSPEVAEQAVVALSAAHSQPSAGMSTAKQPGRCMIKLKLRLLVSCEPEV